MASKTIFHNWVNDVCAHTVVIVSTNKAENVCLKNGLLLHELLSAFSHCDSLSGVIRCTGQNIPVTDGQIRFERASEAKAKTVTDVEELLKSSFSDNDLSRMPTKMAELRGDPPTAWTRSIERGFMRSMTFSEFEMMSQPIVIINVASSTDTDPARCMQELSFVNHTPSCISSGQYDPDIHRVYLLIHDVSESKHVDIQSIQRQLQSKFPPSNVKTLAINSLSSDLQNLQQPDMWSITKWPLYFPLHSPKVDPGLERPINPINGQPVLGSRLSIEDFMTLRSFCISLFHQDVIPALERRMGFLTKTVTDSRKGVKNVLKSFWRKPRDEGLNFVKGGVRYRFDRIETQILLLADTSFMIKDFETALSMYKLVRDDYKADKSNLHIAHTNLMIAAILILTEPSKVKEIQSHLEAIVQLIPSMTEPPHAVAYFALLTSDMYLLTSPRLHLESAQILLQAATLVPRYPAICALLTERGASHFLLGGYHRRYVLHQVLAGFMLRSCGQAPARHAIVCFACAMLMHDASRWGDIRAKLSQALAEELQNNISVTDRRHERSLIALLKTVHYVFNEEFNIGSKASLGNAVGAITELMRPGGTWGKLSVTKSWPSLSTSHLLTGRILPLAPYSVESSSLTIATTSTDLVTEVHGLSIPEVNKPYLSLMVPLNGRETLVPLDGNITSGMSTSNAYVSMLALMTETMQMKHMFDVEKLWGSEVEQGLGIADAQDYLCSGNMVNLRGSLADRWIAGELDLQERSMSYREKNYRSMIEASVMSTSSSIGVVPLGELLIVRVQLRNKLPTALTLSNLRLEFEPSDSFEVAGITVSFIPREIKELTLFAKPTVVGSFSAASLKWNLSDILRMSEPLQRSGPLLQKTIHQRKERLRAEDTTLKFDVVNPYPCINMTFQGVSNEVLQGQLLKSTLILRNEGAAAACELYLKMSQPCFVFIVDPQLHVEREQASLLDAWGQSCSITKLPSSVVIPPGGEIVLGAWLRLGSVGKQSLSVLATYKAMRDGGIVESFGSQDSRSSFVMTRTTVIPSVSLQAKVVASPSSLNQRTCIIDLHNLMSSEDNSHESSVGQIDFDGLEDKQGPSEHQSDQLNEGSCRIEGIWLLGCSKPSDRKGPGHRRVDVTSRVKSMVASPFERIVMPIALQVTDEYCDGLPLNRCVNVDVIADDAHPVSSYNVYAAENKERSASLQQLEQSTSLQLNGHCSWAIPLSKRRQSIPISSRLAPLTSEESNLQLANVLERFLCMQYAANKFYRDITETKHTISAANADENAGPRTISQVRKDRQKESQDGIKDIIGAEARKVATHDHTNIIDRRGISKTCMGIPLTSQELAILEARRGSITLVVVWKCKWQGKFKLGMHSVSNLSLLAQSMPLLHHPVRSLNRMLSPADCILVGIRHPSEVAIRKHTGISAQQPPHQRGAYVPVEITIRSVSDVSLIVSVEAVDKKDRSDTGNPANNSNASLIGNINSGGSQSKKGNSFDEAALAAIAKTSARGLNWQGKTKHMNSMVAPFGTLTLPFMAKIAKAGVFDLKRFRIAVSFQPGADVDKDLVFSEPGHVSYKPIVGQSLVNITDADAPLHTSGHQDLVIAVNASLKSGTHQTG